MDDNDKLDRLLEHSAEMRADIRNLNGYIKAVSENGKQLQKDFIAHEKDTEAHGTKAVHSWFGGVGGILGVVGTALSIYAVFHGK